MLFIDEAHIILVVTLIGDHYIVGSLVPFVAGAKVFCLRLLLNILRTCLDQGKLMSASEQLLIIDIALCTRDHLEDVKELLLPHADELFQLFCTVFLSVGSLVVHCRSCY